MAGFGLSSRTAIAAALALAVGIGAGIAGGYMIWGWPKDWYAFRDPMKLPDTPENALVQYGFQLVVDTPQHIGPLASDASMHYAGNKLACTNCHLNAGLQPFSAPFVSTFATYPRMEMDQVETLSERINGCLTRSMNGKPMPEDGREMNALIAYIQYLDVGTPEGVRVAGMGLRPLPPAAETPDSGRGETVFAASCARCHGSAGQGELANDGRFSIPPLWGEDSFNAGAGMATIETAAAFVRANMPRGIDYRSPVLSVQEAWDVAAYLTTRPRPPAPAQ